jgi:hypothetical protein
MYCPLKSHPDYQALIKATGSEIAAYNAWFAHNKDILSGAINAEPSVPLIYNGPKISSNDRIVFGHPTIGKSFLKSNGDDRFISLDDDYSSEIISEVNRIAKKYSVSSYDVKNGESNAWNKEYDKFMQSIFEIAIKQTSLENKTLLTSNTRLLENNINLFDKVINLVEEEFFKRASIRGTSYNLKDWKNQINEIISKVPVAKVINTSGYLDQLIEPNIPSLGNVLASGQVNYSLESKELPEGSAEGAIEGAPSKSYYPSPLQESNGRTIPLTESSEQVKREKEIDLKQSIESMGESTSLSLKRLSMINEMAGESYDFTKEYIEMWPVIRNAPLAGEKADEAVATLISLIDKYPYTAALLTHKNTSANVHVSDRLEDAFMPTLELYLGKEKTYKGMTRETFLEIAARKMIQDQRGANKYQSVFMDSKIDIWANLNAKIALLTPNKFSFNELDLSKSSLELNRDTQSNEMEMSKVLEEKVDLKAFNKEKTSNFVNEQLIDSIGQYLLFPNAVEFIGDKVVSGDYQVSCSI